LGFTALADTVAALGYSLGSDDGMSEIEKIVQTKCRAEFDSSIDMSIERGKFKGFDVKYEKESEFVDMLKVEFRDIYDRMMKYGRRNISISTVAPTGSLSILAQTSSGIEPIFLPNYKRRRKVNQDDPNAKVAFIDDSGDAFEEFVVWHNGIEEWMKINNKKNAKGNPYEGSSAPEIDWKKRIAMQSLVQKYTTHSISSTINLPEDVSKELVGDIYMEAWKKGTKGITVYRDGSRSGILVSADDKSLESKIGVFPGERPKSVYAKVNRFNNLNEKGENEKWIQIIGEIDGRAYEVFTGRDDEDNLVIPKKIKEGRIEKVKNGTTHYDFLYMTKYGSDDSESSPQWEARVPGISHVFDKKYWAYGKLMSGMLQSEMAPEKVTDLMNAIKTEDDGINSWIAGSTRGLKPYIKNGAKSKDTKCDQEECGDPEGLIYEEGCLKCKSCGHTKCG